MKENTKCVIYTDGASSGNPGPGGWGGVILLSDYVEEIGGRENYTTNNRMEMSALVFSLKRFLEILEAKDEIYNKNINLIDNDFELKIITDSAYLLNGATKWMEKWKINNWQIKTFGNPSKKTEIKNQDLWQKIDSYLNDLQEHGITIKWEKVRGHSGEIYNERCDEIATSLIKNFKFELFKGSRTDYERKFSKSTKSNYYVSFINGEFEIFDEWKDCEKKIKGVSGAKWKKVKNSSEEEEFRRICQMK